MDYVYLTGISEEDLSTEVKKSKNLPKVCYLCKRKEGSTSFGHIIEKETGKKYFNRPIINLGTIKRKISEEVESLYLLCPECAVLLGIEKDLNFDNSGE